jgi:GNAT superfamily N-acetyltransferase
MTEDLERIERAALLSLQEASDGKTRRALGLWCGEIGGALVSRAAGLPASGIVANRTIGLGHDMTASAEAVARIVGHYRDAGVARYFVHLHGEAEPKELRDWLQACGLVKARGWMKFLREAEDPPAAGTSLTLRRAGPDDALAFGRIAADAFDLGPDAAPWVAGLVTHPGWQVFMTFEGETPAGTGALFVEGDVAWLDWGATAPAFRRRGSQRALLRQRILVARELGCRLMATETGEAVEGDPQHSYGNITRMGFREAYLRENYAPPKPA